MQAGADINLTLFGVAPIQKIPVLQQRLVVLVEGRHDGAEFVLTFSQVGDLDLDPLDGCGQQRVAVQWDGAEFPQPLRPFQHLAGPCVAGKQSNSIDDKVCG